MREPGWRGSSWSGWCPSAPWLRGLKPLHQSSRLPAWVPRGAMGSSGSPAAPLCVTWAGAGEHTAPAWGAGRWASRQRPGRLWLQKPATRAPGRQRGVLEAEHPLDPPVGCLWVWSSRLAHFECERAEEQGRDAPSSDLPCGDPPGPKMTPANQGEVFIRSSSSSTKEREVWAQSWGAGSLYLACIYKVLDHFEKKRCIFFFSFIHWLSAAWSVCLYILWTMCMFPSLLNRSLVQYHTSYLLQKSTFSS